MNVATLKARTAAARALRKLADQIEARAVVEYLEKILPSRFAATHDAQRKFDTSPKS